MPTNKNPKTKKWEVYIRYKDVYGNNRRKHKSGFKKESEAKIWEREFLNKVNLSSDMLLSTLHEIYIEDATKRLKITSIKTRETVFNKYILPVFGNIPLNKITPATIRKFQNDLLKYNFSRNYLKIIETSLGVLLNYASKYHNLKDNPMKNYEPVGSRKLSREMNIWTVEQFNLFAEKIKNKTKYYILFNLLFWSGMRIGEVLALSIKDIDFNQKKVTINKTYTRYHKKDIFLSPKTEASKREIQIPDHVLNLLNDFISTFYSPKKDDRVFKKTDANAVRKFLKRRIEKYNLPDIRLHDFRHSHASLLIHSGINILAISKRLGHEDIKTTLNIYAHLYTSENEKLINSLNELTQK